jgi:putative membrane protein insertion efficiency factor
MSWLFLWLVRMYRAVLSPMHHALFGPACRFEPTCSAYAEEAIRELGVVRGTIVAGWRLLRCNPLSLGGYDPLEARSLFPPKPAADPEHKAVA